MKKTAFLLLGILMFSTSFGFVVEASPQKYHFYVFSSKGTIRGHSNHGSIRKVRTFSQRYRAFGRKKNIVRNVPLKKIQKRVAVAEDIRQALENSTFNDSKVPKERASDWKAKLKLVSRDKKVVGGGNLMQTYENDSFSVQIPSGWKSHGEEKGHLFASPFSNYTVEIRRIRNNCYGEGFTSCAITISKSENSSRNIYASGKIERQSRKMRTILNSNKKRPTYTEGFEATLDGKKDVYVSRYYVKDVNDQVFMIETISPIHLSSNYIFTTKRIFDSFRVFGEKSTEISFWGTLGEVFKKITRTA